MSKRTGGVLGLVGMCALSLLLLNCGSSSNRPAGLLYVISQAEFSVASFSIDLKSGALTFVNSNATTCATLTGSNPVSCGLAVSMLLDPTGASALVLNQGVPNGLTTVTSTCLFPPCGIQPTIYPYSVNSDGSFSAPGTPVTWVDQQDNDTAAVMVSDPAVNLLFVMNQGTTPSPANCPHQPTPISSQNPSGDPNDACPSISVFTTQSGSTSLALTGNNCVERNGPCPYRLDRFPTALSVLTFTPPNGGTTQTLLFVTSNKDLTPNHNDNELSVFLVDSSGNLTPQLSPSNLPYTTLPNPGAVQAVSTFAPPQTTGGVFVYVGSQGSVSGSVSAFALCTVVGSQGNGGNNCTPQQVSSNQLLSIGTPSNAGNTPAAMVVDPTNSFLYVVSSGSNQLFAYQISTGTGTLKPLSPASLPTGGAPVALAMQTSFNALNNFIYTSNSQGESISGFAASTTTGSLSTSTTTTLFTPGLPSGMAAR
jgi:Lactonase, 7-bladed beta-propeller